METVWLNFNGTNIRIDSINTFRESVSQHEGFKMYHIEITIPWLSFNQSFDTLEECQTEFKRIKSILGK